MVPPDSPGFLWRYAHPQRSTGLYDSTAFTCAGSHDNGYALELQTLISEGLKHKLVLVPGYTEVAFRIRELELPTLTIPDLFIPEKLPETTLSPYPKSPSLPGELSPNFPSSGSSPSRSALGLGLHAFPDSPGGSPFGMSQRPRKTSILSRQAKRASGISLPPDSPSYFDEKSETVSERAAADSSEELLVSPAISRKTAQVRMTVYWLLIGCSDSKLKITRLSRNVSTSFPLLRC